MNLIKEQERIKKLGFDSIEELLDNYTSVRYTKLGNKLKAQIKALLVEYQKNEETSLGTIKLAEYAYLYKTYENMMKSLKLTKSKVMGTLTLKRDMRNIDAMIHRLNIEFVKEAQISVEELRKNLTSTFEEIQDRENYLIFAKKGVAGSLSTPNLKLIEKIVNKRFNHSTFSERIWKNKNLMIKRLKKEIIAEATSTQNYKKSIKKMLQSYNTKVDFRIKVTYNDMRRLYITEKARVMSEINLNAYKNNDLKQFEFVATLDTRTSDICKEHDNKVYNIVNAEIGVNIPPLHPNCRSTTVPHFSNLEVERIGRDLKTGKSVAMPKSVKNYDDWLKYQTSGGE